ncbi:hypothetical protein C499_08437 [Halogeometricum borinquense DSM 11551]|uniref:Uncharacterized protein n=1 Tax=Halogeometricum borinquense (strain ATCC 700274 / DSM 11551 / JCM 10706 / KCTC 4070 / PR3) TaxID=469382 RepID=E4NMK2_HALBP|nr:hypothetical protein [Halogeometricum borinquense]ADQ68500.1 hypothetical protein Hbor_29610 [Halogeometricum borinquense DSM 11551]ELY27857.1 hypothetical protein C499_08437 [Halogeometricum borinquense DSM 11551]
MSFSYFLVFQFIFDVVFGSGLGMVSGLATLPFVFSERFRAAVEAGPTPELVPNHVALTALGGMLFAALRFAFSLAYGIDSSRVPKRSRSCTLPADRLLFSPLSSCSLGGIKRRLKTGYSASVSVEQRRFSPRGRRTASY